MHILRFDSVCIWSEDPERLAEFYENTLGLELEQKLDLPEDIGYAFKLGEQFFFVGYHDKIKGKAKDPYRIMPGFWVQSVQEIYDELVTKDVPFLRKPSISPDGTYYAATITDPEGNIIQFFSETL